MKTRRFLRRMVVLTVALVLVEGVVPGVASHAADGPSRIVFESDRGGQSDLWLMDADGSNAVQLTNDKADDAFPQFSPDGSQILWGRGVKGVFDLWVMDVDGSGPVQLTVGRRARVSTWSPDGERIAFGSGGDLWMMDADGSSEVNLTSGPAVDLGAVWSPDGQRIAFFSDRNGGSAVYTVAVDGSAISQLTPDELNAGAPGWSPDGTTISFSDNFCAECVVASDLYVMNADGSDIRQLTDSDPANESGNGWSPDGTAIVIDVPDLTGRHLRKPDIAVVSVLDGSVTYLTNTPNISEQHPDWSPA